MSVDPRPVTGPQLNPGQAAAAGAVAVRILAGDLTSVPLGPLIRATVTQTGPGGAVLDVGGKAVTVAPSPALTAGTVVMVRVPPTAAAGANPVLEIAGRAPPTPPGGTAPQAGNTPTAEVPGRPQPPASPNSPGRPSGAPPVPVSTTSSAAPSAIPPAAPREAPARPPKLAVVDVQTAPGPDGRVRVQIDGRPAVATSAEPLIPGGRYVVQVEATPTGLVLRPPPDTPAAPEAAATAVLRAAKPPDLGAVVAPLLKELAAPPIPGKPDPVPAPVREAAAAVREVAKTFLPDPPRPPDAKQLQALVEDGGLHFEAKLARLADDGRVSADGTPAPPPDRREVADAARSDLKGGLLKLLQAAHEFGALAQVPAARAALDGVEAVQAANALADPQTGPFLLQIPFPDNGAWKTANLALEPEDTPDTDTEGGPAGNFKLLMHVPLADLGETWIDAGMGGGRFRAVLYLPTAEARDRVRAELPGLHRELTADGFREVLLDVRPPSDLPANRKARAAAVQAGRPAETSVLDARA